MSRLITAVLLILGMAGPALADSISIGYSAVPVTLDFVSEDAVSGNETQEEEGYTGGVLQVLYTCERKLTDRAALALTTGFGFPMGLVKQELTAMVTGDLTGLSKNATNEGDYIEIGMATIPVLVGVNFEFPSGQNTITAGISAGAGVVAAMVETVMVDWSGPVGSEIKNSTETGYISVYIPTIMVLANLGYNIKVGEESTIGFRVPLGFYSTSRQIGYMVEEIHGTVPAGSLRKSEEGFRVGGLTYGAHVVWSRDF